jgi:hypothetical protein
MARTVTGRKHRNTNSVYRLPEQAGGWRTSPTSSSLRWAILDTAFRGIERTRRPEGDLWRPSATGSAPAPLAFDRDVSPREPWGTRIETPTGMTALKRSLEHPHVDFIAARS